MKFLIVDDHAIVRRGIHELLAEEFPEAHFDERATGEEAIEASGSGAYDVVVLDISLPGRGGLDALKAIRADKPQLPVIVLSQHTEEEYAIRAFRAGARAYLTKRSAPEDLVRAVKTVVDGGTYVTASVAAHLVTSLEVERGKPPHEALSDRELQVLRMIAGGRAVKEIASELSLSEKTVSTYRARVLEKLEMKSNAELMRYALRVGLVD